MACAFNPNGQEVEAGGSLSSSQPGLGKLILQDRLQGYIEKLCLENKNRQTNKQKDKAQEWRKVLVCDNREGEVFILGFLFYNIL